MTEICEEDAEMFLENEETNSQGQNDYTIDKEQIPQVGMHFETRDKTQVFSTRMPLQQDSRSL